MFYSLMPRVSLTLLLVVLALCHPVVSMIHLPAINGIVTLRAISSCNYYAAIPIARNVGNHKFSVKMLKKPCKMAIGYSFSQDDNERKKYMTPSYTSEGKYISMGGAGFVYPMTKQTGGTYKEGDTVEVAIDFIASVISFSVNNREITRVDFPSNVAHVYPSVSSEPGEIEIELKYEVGKI